MKIKVRMWVTETAFTYHVTFTLSPGQQQVGRGYSLNSQEEVFALMRKAHATLEDINIVEMALSQRRPCSVVLGLTQDQFARLCRKPPASAPPSPGPIPRARDVR